MMEFSGPVNDCFGKVKPAIENKIAASALEEN
jgi:hypothetical protein